MCINHPGLKFVSLVLLAGAILMTFFVILSGVNAEGVSGRTYFLRANTAGITGARDWTQWNYFYICGDRNTNCDYHVAPAFGEAWAPNPSGAPAEMIGSHANNTTSRRYFYLWRFAWVFYLLALIFMVATLLASLVLMCLSRVGDALLSLATLTCLVLYTVAVVLMTVVFAMARNDFRDSGREARIGSYAFGFSWGSWACLLLAWLLYTSSCFARRRRRKDAY